MAVTDNLTDQETKVRERAYQLWEQEGRPDGRAQEHWKMAHNALADDVTSAVAQGRKSKAKVGAGSNTKAKPVSATKRKHSKNA